MRVLQLLSQIQPTGAETYAVTLAHWLKDHGHQVHIVSDKLHLKTDIPFFSLPVHSNSLKQRIKSIYQLRKFLQQHSIQIIHCHSRAAARLAFWATKGTKISVISTLHGRQPLSLSKKLLNIYGDFSICICENLFQKMTEKLLMSPDGLRLIRNPVDEKHLSFVSTNTQPLRIAWIGRFTGPKGQRAQHILQAVVPKLLQKFPQLQIDFIGGDPALLGSPAPHSQIHFESHIDSLDQQLEKYHLVFGAGRVAITALLRGVPTYAIGEYNSAGLVTPQNLPEALRSNFGDIGPDSKAMAPVDYDRLTQEVCDFLQQPTTVLPAAARALLREEALKNFAKDLVCKKIFSVYKSAYFKRNHPQNIPILMYHKIPEKNLSSRHRIFVSKDLFEKQLEYFQKQGFTTLHFSDLEAFRSGQRDLREFPHKPLILTFDDGYVDNLVNAAPLLKKHNMKAVIYLLADHNLSDNKWDSGTEEQSDPLMSLEQKKKLLEFGVFEVGSHGFRHEKITEMSEPEALIELRDSKTQLESDLGVSVVSFAYTYGVTSERAAQLAEEAGYDFAVNTDSGGLHLEDQPFGIFRVNVFPEDGPAQLRKKTSHWYRRYFYYKRGR